MEQISQKENYMNNSNKQSTLDTNKNSILFNNSGKYFTFSKDSNNFNSKLFPNTSGFNINESVKRSLNNSLNENSFLNKKRKLMTSEELELEQIERERKEVKKMMEKNMALYCRTKSGTTTIVSKIRDNIYNSNIHNTNTLPNNNNNNFNLKVKNNLNKINSYAKIFMKEKGMNQINIPNNNNIKQTQEVKNNNISLDNINKNETNEKINTNNENNKDTIEKEENIISNDININEEEGDQEPKNEEENISSKSKTPNKESSYLSKMKQLGSMSKLDLCSKIQKYTEICQQVLKEQENLEEEDEDNITKDKKKKKGKKKKNKKSSS